MRTGVLADASIKEQYPEMFPLDIGLQQAMFAPTMRLPKMNKAGRKVKHATDYARFPIYDIKNFARLATPQNAVQAGFEGILNYRQKIGSTNVPSGNLQQGYEEQKEQVYTMRVPEPVKRVPKFEERLLMSTPATLSLGRVARNEGVYEFNRKFKQQSIYLQPQTKALLMNLGNDAQVQRIVDNVFPPPLRSAKYHHNDALNILRKAYKDNPLDIEILSRAERASRTQDRLPDRSNFGALIVDPFGRFRTFDDEEEFQQLLEESAEDEGETLLNPDDRV
mgnify:CR=1 FL=1|tara:strand:+ start:3599 stop:4435 length:837 start_codon:yes stop_codon:yes gene_type:complete